MKNKSISLCAFWAFLLLSVSLSAQIPTNGLVGYWPFNGNATDESGNGNHGTVNGATLTTDRFGNANSAYYFDGLNDFIQGNNAGVTLPTGSSPVSICVWVKNTGGTHNGANSVCIYHYGQNSVAGKSFHLHMDLPTRNIYYGTGYGGGVSIGSLSGIDTNWHFVTVIYEGVSSNMLKIYLDGILNNETTTANAPDILLSSLWQMGRFMDQNGYFGGKLDDILIYNRALTPVEISLLYNESLCEQNITVTDTINKIIIDGRDCQTYPIEKIGSQWWMKENLAATKYKNGTAIPNVVLSSEWSNLTTGALSYYDNDSAQYAQIYGPLYNWYAVNDSRKICPNGWRVPSDDDWTELTTALGGESVASGKMKETGTTHWTSPNTGATNESGFMALPGGNRIPGGTSYNINDNAFFWTSSENTTNNAWYRVLYYNSAIVGKADLSKNYGYSVRCIKSPCEDVAVTIDTTICHDQTLSVGVHVYYFSGTYHDTLLAVGGCDSIITTHLTIAGQGETITDTIHKFILDGRDCNYYSIVKIGNQWWMKENLNAYKYTDGTSIPNDPSAASWASLTSGALCYYNNDSAQYAEIYGPLYNWYAVNDSRKICPYGWHVPGDDEWKVLEMGLGMSQAQADLTAFRGSDEGGKLKESGLNHWQSPNLGATNSSGFTGLPSGFRHVVGTFHNIQISTSWWSSTQFNSDSTYDRYVDYENAKVYRIHVDNNFGFSVRCLKDPCEDVAVTIDTTICPGGSVTVGGVAYDATGTYVIPLTSVEGCDSLVTLNLTIISAYENEEICLVTFDQTSGKNQVIWNKTEGVGIASYNIYKEVSGGIYGLLSNQLFGSAGVYTDYMSNPDVHSDRYKISAIDSCGNESEKSFYHNTMNLTLSQGVPSSNMGLSWTPYEDESGLFTPATYYIYRGATLNSFSLIDSISASNTNYNDINVYGIYYYKVSIKREPACGSINESFSNIVDNSAFFNPAVITVQPVSVEVCSDQTASFSVAATGDSPLNYQWYFNGSIISGATNSTYAISTTANTNEGNYFCIVSNGSGSDTSEIVLLTVNPLPNDIAQSGTSTGSVPVNGLVAYWPYNGTAEDMSGNGYHGTINGVIPSTDRFGNPDGAYFSEGANKYVVVPNFNVNFDSFSMSFWMNLKTNQDWMRIITQVWDIGSNPGSVSNHMLNTGSFYDFGMDVKTATEGRYTVWNGVPIDSNQWYHMTITLDNNQLKLFNNGNLMNTVTTDGGLKHVVQDLYLGGDYVGYKYKGSLDDIRIYNRALTQAEIVALYNETNPLSVSITNDSICSGTSTSIEINNSQNNISYQLISGSTPIGAPVTGTGGTVTLPTDILTANTQFTITATEPVSGCTITLDTVLNVIVVQYPTTANAGPDQIGEGMCGLTSTTLAANTPSVGAGTWGIVSGSGGSFTNINSPTTTFSGIAGESYQLQWTISNAPCGSSSDDVVVTFHKMPPMANAGPDQTGAAMCGLTTTQLEGNIPAYGYGVWNHVSGSNPVFENIWSPTTQFTGEPGETYVLQYLTYNDPCGPYGDYVTITFEQNPTTANAGPDQLNITENFTNLAANEPATGTGIWQIISGTNGNILSVEDNTSPFTGTQGETYTLAWNITNDCGTSTDTVIISFGCQPPVVTLGNDTSICGFSTTIEVQVSGGVSPYTYQWSNSSSTDSVCNINISGNHVVTVTDNTGCSATDTIMIVLNPIPYPFVTGAQSFCEGGSTILSTQPFSSYEWQDGSATQSITITDPGTYWVTVTNQYGCTGSSTPISVGEISNPVVNLGNDTTICANASITLNAYAGPGCTYIWSNGQTTSLITVSTSGQYSVTATNSSGCTDRDTIQVSKYLPIQIGLLTANTLCGQALGSATANVTGGTQPYNYLWSNGDTTDVATGLGSGIFMLYISDANGCQNTATVLISSSNGPNITSQNATNVSCYGVNNGSIEITVSGGTLPYDFEWSNGDSTQNISNLAAGPYEVIVTDHAGCQAVQSINVTQPQPLMVTISSTNASCGNQDGSASASVSGGTTPYNYLWSNNATTASASTLGFGTYILTVQDANLCEVTTTTVITESGAPAVVIDSVINATCSGNDGAIYISVPEAGTFSYQWTGGSSDEDLVNAEAGIYSVTVTGGGCTAIAQAEIEVTAPLIQSLCIVSVDNTLSSPKNMLVWEKAQTTGISHYKIYKESSAAGVYLHAASVPYNAMSKWIDVNSNPKTRAYRYKIAQVDSCGNESPQSDFHKTIHLTINLGQGNDMNLIWNHYYGYEYLTYVISRYHSSTGWVDIDSIPGDLNTYTDDVAPATGNLKYQVSALRENECWAEGDAKDMSGPFSQSLSNIEDNGIIDVGISSQIYESEEIKIYPNPVKEELTIEINSDEIKNLEILTIIGKTMYTQKIEGKTTLNTTNLPAGVYLVKIYTEKSSLIKRFIKQ